ncbi:alpha-glucosidase [Neobacillus notoginsengisoli]|uniref:Alpha-glucosidase n=1 Tax=Neobacillus notoginsengisoli TaxID=1578198 RepID=A0A417Z078_9BACI|nr:alpha-glucosidase [Neobacillus notoginsengisoli]RHW43559.1 alpha-glucosidase [Neobacillus notoginsengisoli]
MDLEWWHKSVIYHLYPRSFQDTNGDGIGDLKGIISRLDYIQKLGTDLIWLCPVYASPNDDNGYDISDYYSINPEYGTMAEMEELIEETSRRGIGIMMDIVANHTSDEHPWFMASRQDKSNPYRDFYVWRDGKDGSEPSDLSSIFSGSAWEYEKQTGQYYLHLFSKKQPDLNWHHLPVRKAMYDVMRFWIKKGIKGFRFDVIDLIAKDIDKDIVANGPLLHDYLQEMHREVHAGTNVVTVGETGSADLTQAILYTSPERKELNMVFSFEHMALDEVPGKQKWDLKPLVLNELKAVFSTQQTELAERGWNSLFWSNHDQPRIVSRWGNDDQYRYESATMLATLLHMMRGTPFIYQGEEIGMTNVKFPDIDSYRDIETLRVYEERLRKGVPHEEVMSSIYTKGRDNARTPMQWNNSDQAGFTTGTPWLDVNPNYNTVNVEDDLHSSRSIFNYYQRLISIRKMNDIVVYGKYELLETEQEVFAYTRKLDKETWYVICNFTGRTVRCKLLEVLPEGEVLIHNYGFPILKMELRPYESFVYIERNIPINSNRKYNKDRV